MLLIVLVSLSPRGPLAESRGGGGQWSVFPTHDTEFFILLLLLRSGGPWAGDEEEDSGLFVLHNGAEFSLTPLNQRRSVFENKNGQGNHFLLMGTKSQKFFSRLHSTI